MRTPELERDIGAVLLPEVRLARTRPGAFSNPADVRPARAYLERFPPAGLVVFGRGSEGPGEPGALLEEVRAELRELGHPAPFAACDLEQGAGLHFASATRLPPALALAAAALRDADPQARALGLRSAGALTAREARERGIELVLAPVADVNVARDNPIIAVRSFGDDGAQVSECALAWQAGLVQGGALAAAKHFPGHGSTRGDSHLGLPRVGWSERAQAEGELRPFGALARAGVAAMLVAHLDAPALTGEAGLPTTLSPQVLGPLLRDELGFAGAVLSDAMDMGALSGVERPYARALAAGCDGLVCPADPLAAAEEIAAALERGELAPERLAQAAERMRGLRARALAAPDPAAPADGLDPAALPGSSPRARARFALDLARRALRVSTPRWSWKLGGPCEVLTPLHQVRGLEARALIHGLRAGLATSSRPRGVLLPVVLEVGAGLGRYAPTAAELEEIDAKLAALVGLGWPVGLLWFGSPQALPAAWWQRPDRPVLLAYAATPPMTRAAQDFLEGRVDPGGFLPTRLG